MKLIRIENLRIANRCPICLSNYSSTTVATIVDCPDGHLTCDNCKKRLLSSRNPACPHCHRSIHVVIDLTDMDDTVIDLTTDTDDVIDLTTDTDDDYDY